MVFDGAVVSMPSLEGEGFREPRTGGRILASIERAADVDDFLATPDHRWFGGRCVMAWTMGDLVGAAVWGEPTPADAELLARIWDGFVPGRTAPLDKVFDVRHLARIADDTFRAFVALARERAPVSRVVRRQVLLAPPGIAGAVAHGFWNLVPSGHPWHVTDDDAAGFAWLGYPDEVRAGVAAALEAARAPDVIARVRAWLDTHLASPSQAEAARALGMAPRSLQRHLADARTTFRALIRNARIGAARRLLASPHAKIDAVAIEVGCGTTSSFVRMFREATGETPAAWRDRVAQERRGDA